MSESAIRKRIKRGTLDHEKPEDGKVLVYLDAASAPSAPGTDIGPNPNTEALIATKDETMRILRKQLEAERRANDENRRLLLAAMDRIPALEASSEERGSPETPTEPVPGTEAPPKRRCPLRARGGEGSLADSPSPLEGCSSRSRCSTSRCSTSRSKCSTK